MNSRNVRSITSSFFQSFETLSSIFFLILGYLRGYMKSCYHKSCDNYIEARKNEKRYNNSLAFLTKTTQALVLTILDLTTNDFNNWVDKDNATYDHSTANHYRNQRDIPIKLRRDKGVDISTFTGLYF